MADTRVLLVYHSAEGQTAKITRRIAAELEARGVAVDVADAGDAPPPGDHIDAVVLGDSIHVGRHSRSLTRYAKANASVLAARPLALFQVSLTSATDDEAHATEAHQLLQGLIDAAELRPDVVGLFAGSLAYTRYGWITRRVMRRIAAADGRETDTGRDHEYTDWAAVDHFARDVAALVTGSGVEGGDGD